MGPRRLSAAAGILALVVTAPAHAVIRIDMSLGKIIRSSRQVVMGEVARVDAAGGEVEVKVVETMVGARSQTQAAPTEGTIRIQFEPSAEPLRRLAAKGPAVIFLGMKGGVLHVGDAWHEAVQVPPATFKVTGTFETPYLFPGRTRALIRIVRQLKEHPAAPAWGRDSVSAADLAKHGEPLLDLFEHSNFGASFDLGALGVRPKAMAAADVNGDRKCDLLVLAADGARLYLGTGPKCPFQDATAAWGLAGARASAAAFGDVDGDGRADVLLAGLWVNTGSRFLPAKAAVDLAGQQDVLAVALADVSGDGRRDAVVLCRGGKLLAFANPGRSDQAWKQAPPRQLWEDGDEPLAAHFGDWGDNGRLHVMVIRASGLTRYALDDDGGPPADFRRLTGQPAGKGKGGFTWTFTDYNASAAIDLNGGNGRMDLVIDTRRGKGCDAVLMNRGYGAFWRNNEGTVELGKKGFTPVAMTAADMYGDGSHELLVADASGRLMQLNSPPYKRGKPAEE